MRKNLTKKDLVNSIYMQVGFSKQVTENLIDEFFSIIVSNLCKNKSEKFVKKLFQIKAYFLTQATVPHNNSTARLSNLLATQFAEFQEANLPVFQD